MSQTPIHRFEFDTHRYGAFGLRPSTDDGARTGYTNATREANVDWYMLGDRFYVPSLRRLVRPDPFAPFDEGGLNRYAYCGGDPINRIDPTGNAWWDWLGAALGIVGAVVGIAATGGALLGVLGAAAAGSLTAAVSTTAMATMTAAVVLDVASVAVEVGSIVSLAIGDETAAGIFGWMALGAGIASVGLAGVARLGRHAGAGTGMLPSDIGPGERSRGVFIKSNVKIKRAQGYARATYTSLDEAHRVKAYKGRGAIRKKIPCRAVTNSRGKIVDVVPEWSEVRNARGGINYLADTAINGGDLVPVMSYIAQKQDTLPVVVLSGVHGALSGGNWSKGRRDFINRGAFLADQKNAPILAARAGKSGQFAVYDIYQLPENHLPFYTGAPAHIVHAYCFGVTDWNVMKLLNIPFSRAFDI